MKTKIVSLVLCLAVVFNLLPTVNVSAEGENFTKDGITYEINLSKPDEVSIVEIDDSLEILDIKHSVKNNDGAEYTVKSLSTNFMDKTSSNLGKIVLPVEGIDICAQAFMGFEKLTTIENLNKTSIQSSDYLFYDCISLSKVNLPESLETIGSYMFFECRSLRTVIIEKNTEEARDDHCNLEVSKVKKIGVGAFGFCENLKYVNLPESVGIEEHAFEGTRKLIAVNNLDKSNILSGDYLFKNCVNLIEINIPKNLNVIGQSMFENCRSLRKSLTIGKDVKEVGKDAFLGCHEVDVHFEYGSKLNKIGQGAFCGCENLRDCNIPESTSEIGNYAFTGCENLNPIRLSSTVNVGLYSFPEGKITGPEVKRDKNLEEQNEIIETFLKGVLDREIKLGHNIDRLAKVREIDKLFYENIPNSTDKPDNVVDTVEKFEEMASKGGRFKLYRGIKAQKEYPHLITKDDKLSAEEVSKNFKESDFYYPFECDGIHCTMDADYAATYADIYVGKYADYKPSIDVNTGVVMMFCFTDMSSDKFKMMKSSELSDIQDFYKYFHVKDYSECLSQEVSPNRLDENKYTLKLGILGVCAGLSRQSFIARALGCDVINNGEEFKVLNRKKLTVCRVDLTEKYFHNNHDN